MTVQRYGFFLRNGKKRLVEGNNIPLVSLRGMTMQHTIKIRKGLDIPLGGEAEKSVIDLRGRVQRYAVKPTDVVGFAPRLRVAEGDRVAAGQPLVADKRDPRITLPSPVDGVVRAIVRGEKRRLEAIVVECGVESGEWRAENEVESGEWRTENKECGSPLSTLHSSLSAQAPVWWMVRERPFGVVANPDHKPKGIYVSLRDTNPLAPDLAYALQGREQEFERGVAALGEWAEVHVVRAEGPHPAGNIGTIVSAMDPINKGECVWHVGAQDVANIGRWLLTGEYRPERLIAAGGPAAKAPHYYRVLVGACVEPISEAQLMTPGFPSLTSSTISTRIISGSPLSGTAIHAEGYLGLYDQQLCFLSEGDGYEFMGWLMPGWKKFSFSRTFLSGFKGLGRMVGLGKQEYDFSTRLHGSVRPFLFTGQMERVFPFDIYPLQLIKACIVGDMELQEQLGIYEVEPEDFALCEFIDPSKTEIQTIIREALERLRMDN